LVSLDESNPLSPGGDPPPMKRARTDIVTQIVVGCLILAVILWLVALLDL